MYVDTHCHLNFNWFDDDRAEVIDRARQIGVTRILNPGIDLESSFQAITLAENYPEVYAAVGVHPNDGKTWNKETQKVLRELAQHPKVVAIGEIGLDFYRESTPIELQVFIFKEQLVLAAEIGLPVVVHTRNVSDFDHSAYSQTMDILSQWQSGLMEALDPLGERPGVLHSFSDNESGAERAIKHNFAIGISGPVTFKNASGLRAVIEKTPVSSLLGETDAPFLTPHPHRGKRNEPAYVRYVAEKIGEVKEIEVERTNEVLNKNAKRLFHW